MQFSIKNLLFVITILSAPVFITGCKNFNRDHDLNREYYPQKTNAHTNFSAAMEYEFRMIRHPFTGLIPEGSFTGEQEQARAVLANQQQNNIIAANSYSLQGPDNLGGRTRAVVYDTRYDGGANRIILAGGVSGGVYKSADDGATWVRKSPVGDHFSCTSIAQDTRPGSRDTWYYTTGESSGNSASSTGAFYLGKGAYKSTDNGETWTHLGLLNSSTLEGFNHRTDLLSKVVVDPTNGNVYVAACDAIYRSTDGGATWAFALTSGSGGWSSSMMTDIIVTAGGRFYAAFSGTSNSLPTDMPGVWTSTTGAPGSWTKIAGSGAGPSPAGWNATGSYGRVVLAYAPSLDSRVYALYYSGGSPACPAATPEAEFFYWDDGLSTWTDVSATLPDEAGCLAGNDPFAVQSGYNLVIAVKPDDPATVFIGGTNAYRSTDAGLTWTRIGGYASPLSYALYTDSHPDIHAFAFPPTSTTTMICGNDGGIQRTTDNLAGTVDWAQINIGYNTYQYYHVTVDPRLGEGKVMGGTQDNGTSRNIGGMGASHESIFGGDGVSVGLSDLAGGIQYEYVGFQFGEIFRRDATLPPGFGSLITPPGESGTGLFVTMFKLDPDNTEKLYYANDNALYRTASASTVLPVTWTSLPGVALSVGAPNDITALATTRGTYSSVTASLFIGTSHGKLFRLDDPSVVAAGTPPVEITGAGFPVSGYVSSIAVNPRNDDTVLVTFSNYGVTSVFWTGTANDAVPAWSAVEGTLTLPSYRSSAIAITADGVAYFVGTSAGLYTSLGLPGAVAWTQEGPAEIGNAVVSGLSLRASDNKLLVGTHGHAMWSTSLSMPVVPVTLTEFKGTLQQKQVLLQWSTSTEVNSKHFELEKSFDGTGFRKIATIPAAGFSNTVQQYRYFDLEKLHEKNYYRLRSVDIDEQFEMSEIILIKPPGIRQEMIVLNNPFTNSLLIRFVKVPETDGQLRLTDMSGRLMASRKIYTGEQQVQFMIPPGKLGRGIYLLQAELNGNTFLKQVLKE